MENTNADALELQSEITQPANEEVTSKSDNVNYLEFFSDDSQPVDSNSGTDTTTSSEDWEAKYKTLQGKYNAEVPKLHRELKQYRKETDELRAKIAVLETMLQTNTATNKQDDVDEDLAKLKEDYPEIYTAVNKMLNKVVTQEVRPTVDAVKATSAKATFYSALSSMIPDWEQINSSQSFLDWLAQPSDEIPTRSRHQLLMAAFNEGDAAGVAAFFKRFKMITNNEKSGAEKMVSPPYRKTGKTVSISDKIFTESEITNFYKKAAMGKIQPDRKAELERAIKKAVLENRVLYGK